MRHLYTLLAAAVVMGLGSCSSSRNAQNADDVYYSNGGKSTTSASGGSEYYSTAPSDNYIRMEMSDPARWSQFDDYNAYDSYYYSPAAASMGYGYGYPAYGFGYGYPAYGMGLGYGFGYGGMGLWDPYMAWNSYFMWNAMYNPFFYNPYYGVPVMIVGQAGPTAMYSNLRPFNSLAYRNGLYAKTGTSTNHYYRPGMSGTTAYNHRLSNTARPVNGTYYRPAVNHSSGGFRPAFSNPGGGFSRPSFGGGGGFHGGRR